MKKILMAVVILAATAMGAKAQKGSILLYGNLGVTSSKDASGNKTSSFQIAPGVGYQFNDAWTAGLNIGYSSNKSTPVVGSSYTANEFMVGPFIRYAQPLASVFSIYEQLNVGYVHDSYTGGGSASGFGASLTPVISANLKNGFALNFGFGGLQYNTSKVSGASSSSNNFALTFGTGASFGISKNFGGSHRK